MQHKYVYYEQRLACPQCNCQFRLRNSTKSLWDAPEALASRRTKPVAEGSISKLTRPFWGSTWWTWHTKMAFERGECKNHKTLLVSNVFLQTDFFQCCKMKFMVKERHKRIWVQKLLGRIDCWDFLIQKNHQWYVIDIKYIYYMRILLLSVWLQCLYCHGYHGCSRSIDISPGGRTVGTSNQSFLGHQTPKVDVVAIHGQF